jgi:EAL domain-containing protein (putative c-di-GMP-specific phosphodiesterase class I)
MGAHDGSGTVGGFEALPRITEPDGSVTLPAAFVPTAEDSGLVVPLGAQVLHMACLEACRWQPADRPQRRLTVAVNLPRVSSSPAT